MGDQIITEVNSLMTRRAGAGAEGGGLAFGGWGFVEKRPPHCKLDENVTFRTRCCARQPLREQDLIFGNEGPRSAMCEATRPY